MTLDLLDLADPPTAIVAASDVQAVGVLEAAESKGMKVPYELSVVGYDDIEGLASLMGLTTVRQPLERSGARAADLVRRGARCPAPFGVRRNNSRSSSSYAQPLDLHAEDLTRGAAR